MDKIKKTAKLFLCVSLVLMLLCGIVVSAVQTSGGKVVMKELNIETDSGYTMSAYLFIPKTATADNPAPAIVTSHGYLNIRSLAPDAEIVVHETWSYNAADAPIGGAYPDWPVDQAGMYARLETNYLALARENGLRVIPVGLAVQKRRKALAARGGVFDPATLEPGAPIDLRGEPVGALSWKDGRISGDTIHLNKAGEYMQAMAWLGFLFDRDVREIAFAPAAAGDAETCAALRAAAQDALDEAKARGWQDFAPKKAGPPVVHVHHIPHVWS